VVRFTRVSQEFFQYRSRSSSGIISRDEQVVNEYKRKPIKMDETLELITISFFIPIQIVTNDYSIVLLGSLNDKEIVVAAARSSNQRIKITQILNDTCI